MQDEHASAPDWRRAETYRPMLGAEPAVWAWEFARRGLVNNGLTAAEPNLPGLCFADPGPAGQRLPAILWRPDPCAAIVLVRAARANASDALDLAGCDLPILVVRTELGDQQVLICDGPRRLRLAVIEGDILNGPVTCQLALPEPGGAAAGLASLRALIALRDTGRLPAATSRPPSRAKRWLESLQAHDARRAGASQREIAALLFGQDRVREDWAGRSDYMRMRVHRLLRTADRLVAGGYRSLLGMSAKPWPPRVNVVETWRSAAWFGQSAVLTAVAGIILEMLWLCAGLLHEPCGFA